MFQRVGSQCVLKRRASVSGSTVTAKVEAIAGEVVQCPGCAAGEFEEDPWSISVEAGVNVAAKTKILGNEYKVQGGVSVSAMIDSNGKIEVGANAKLQHSKAGHMTTYKSSAKVYGGGGGPTGTSVTTSVSEALQDSAFARAPSGALLNVVERPR